MTFRLWTVHSVALRCIKEPLRTCHTMRVESIILQRKALFSERYCSSLIATHHDHDEGTHQKYSVYCLYYFTILTHLRIHTRISCSHRSSWHTRCTFGHLSADRCLASWTECGNDHLEEQYQLTESKGLFDVLGISLTKFTSTQRKAC